MAFKSRGDNYYLHSNHALVEPEALQWSKNEWHFVARSVFICLFWLVKPHLTSEGPRMGKLKFCPDFLSKPCVFFSPGDERSRESPAPAEAQMQAGAEGGGRVSRCCWKCSVTQLKKIFWGVAVVLGVCSSWSGSTQLAKLTFKKFDAPFTLTWFATNWNFLFFPLYYLGHVFKSAEKQSPKQRYRYGSFCFFLLWLLHVALPLSQHFVHYIKPAVAFLFRFVKRCSEFILLYASCCFYS